MPPTWHFAGEIFATRQVCAEHITAIVWLLWVGHHRKLLRNSVFISRNKFWLVIPVKIRQSSRINFLQASMLSKLFIPRDTRLIGLNFIEKRTLIVSACVLTAGSVNGSGPIGWIIRRSVQLLRIALPILAN